MAAKELLEAEAVKLQAIETDLSKAIANRQQLESQMRENEAVVQELKAIKEDDDKTAIYKLVGPTLLKQDRAEALENVEKRVEFIKGEIERVEKLLSELQEKQEKKRNEVVELQQKLQAQFQQQQQQVAEASA